MSANRLNIKYILTFWWARIILFLALTFLIGYIAGIIFAFIPIGDSITQRMFKSGSISFISLLLSTLILEKSRTLGSNDIIGLNLDKRSFIDSIKGAVIVAIFFLLIAIIAITSGGEAVINEEQTNSFLLFTLSLVLYATNEELIFRGFIFQTLIEKFNPIFITILISTLFSIVHAQNPNANLISLINVFLAGVFLSVLYLATRSLWLPISFHIIWNWSQHVMLGSPISGIDFDNEIFIVHYDKESEFLTTLLGNQFGIEEGLLSSVYLIVLSYYFMKKSKPSPFITSKILKRKYLEDAIQNS